MGDSTGTVIDTDIPLGWCEEHKCFGPSCYTLPHEPQPTETVACCDEGYCTCTVPEAPFEETGSYTSPHYDANEQDILLDTFHFLLVDVTRDGGRKRASGLKPPWWRDPSHEAAIWSHINRWKHGEVADPDSSAHPLVHAAWRMLAIAWQESHGKRDPREEGYF